MASDHDAAHPDAVSSIVERVRGFGPVGILSIVLVLATGNVIGAAFALLWARLSRTPWPELGFGRPRSWIADIAVGIVCGVAFKLLIKAIVFPLLGFEATNRAYAFLVGNRTALARTFILVIVGGGFGEETIWRGFLFQRSAALLGTTLQATVITVFATSLLFASAHLPDQGIVGASQAFMSGLAFGIAYVRLGRLWPIMAAHAAFDVTAALMIYWNLETQVAHLVVR